MNFLSGLQNGAVVGLEKLQGLLSGVLQAVQETNAIQGASDLINKIFEVFKGTIS